MHDFYVIEPQSVQYTTHGDLWDYMYDMSRQDDGAILLCFGWTDSGLWGAGSGR
jgi:hypothetical protein